MGISMPVTITDKTVNPLLVTDGQSLTAYKGVTVTDTNPLSTTETVSITLAQTQNPALGPNFDFYPTVTNYGSISDPNGGGTWNPTTETFTESGVIGGDPTFATTLLSRLQYNAPQLPNGQAFATQASITVTDGAVVTTDGTPVIVGDVAPPAITGTVANEPIASGDKIPPFATMTLTEPYIDYNYYTLVAGTPNNTYVGGPNYNYNPKDSVSITITDGGKATDADGLLTGPGLSKTGVGTYTLGPDYAYNIESELRGLSFQTVAVAAGQTMNPSFELDVTDSTSNLTTKDTTTSLSVIGPQLVPVAPTIAGTLAGQSVTPGNVLDPFASVTVSDTNPTPTDSVTITLMNASGQATDANGTLAGTGLTETAAGSGIYTLAATTPTTLTTELDALTFHPTGLPSGVTSETTGFTLAVTDPSVSKTATDTKTTVIESPTSTTTGTGQPIGPPSGNYYVQDETTGKSYYSPGEPYTGPVAGLTSDISFVTTDNLNITAIAPNSFIHTGSGEDGINVSGSNGNNILDGSTGSNFLIGGSGNDAFYIDDRAPAANVWSTIVNFHTGDAATIWGITQQNSTMTVSNGLGAAGFTGLTLDFNVPGQPVAGVTLTGMTSADMTNGTLAISYGRTGDLPGLPGSDYMTIIHT
jgi:hypothetical protein